MEAFPGRISNLRLCAVSGIAALGALISGVVAADNAGGPESSTQLSEIVVTAPEVSQGDLMGDLNAKRGRIQGSSAAGNGEVEIVALVPTSEVLRYAIDLRSLTQGRGRFTITHSHYDPVPAHLVDKLLGSASR